MDQQTHVKTPSEFNKRDWKQIFKRLRDQIELDNVGIVAPGVAFFAFLGIFPLLAAFLSIYGLVAGPEDVIELMESAQGLVPDDIIAVFQDQLIRLASQNKLSGWALVISIGLALWTGSKAVKGMITALNIAYGEKENRNFFMINAVALVITVGGLVSGAICVFLLAGLPAIMAQLPLGGFQVIGLKIVRWILLALIILTSLSVLYRFAPCRPTPKWRWITPGSSLATLIWLIASAGFSWYVANFADYNKAYGSLAAIAMLLVWLSLSAYVFILGAELDSELERQAGINQKSNRKQATKA